MSFLQILNSKTIKHNHSYISSQKKLDWNKWAHACILGIFHVVVQGHPNPSMDKVCLYAQHIHVWTRFVCMPDTPIDGQGLFVCPTHPWMDKVCLYARHTHGWTRFVCMPVMIKNTKLKYNLLTSSQNTFIDNKYCDIHLFSRSQSRMEVIKKSAEYYLYSCQVIRCFHVYPVWY